MNRRASLLAFPSLLLVIGAESVAAPPDLAAARFTQKELALFGPLAPGMDTAEPWEMFTTALKGQIAAGEKWPGLQVVSVPRAADWNDPTYGNYYTYRIWGDTLPKWTTTYDLSSDKFSEGYQIFLNNINVPAPNETDKAALRDLRLSYEATKSRLRMAFEDVGQKWLDFDRRQQSLPSDRRRSFDQWYQEFEASKVAGLRQEVGIAASKYAALLNKIGGGHQIVGQAIMAFDNDAYMRPALSPDGTTFSYRSYTITPSLTDFVKEGQASAAAGNPPQLRFKIDRNSGRSHRDESSFSASASYGWFFSASVSSSSLNVDVHNEGFSIEFSAQAYRAFTITPGDWYSGTVVNAYGKGPFIPDGPVAQGHINLFGESGVLSLRPTTVIVAFRPRVRVTLSKSDYSLVKSSFSAGGGFSIGPFGFGGRHSHATEDVQFDDQSSSFTATDSSDIPKVMAVVNDVLGPKSNGN